ncbi:MAG: ABC transporter permease [Beijerinckiaceae bacterium]
MRVNLPAAVFALLLLALWEAGARAAGNPFFPTVEAVAAAIVLNAGAISGQMLETLRRAAIGLAIACTVMIPLGAAIGRMRLLGDIFEPIVNMLRPLPPPAVAPIALLFAGAGDGGKIAMIVFTCSFPILIGSIDGVRANHPMLTNVARSLRLSRLETIALIDLPSALPVIMTGIRLAVAAALLVSVISEMLLTTNGIGVYLLRAQENFRIADGLAGVVAVACVGFLINDLFLRFDRKLLAWHYATTGDGAQQ